MIGKRGDARTFQRNFWGETMRLLIAGLALVIAVVAVNPATAQAQQWQARCNAALQRWPACGSRGTRPKRYE